MVGKNIWKAFIFHEEFVVCHNEKPPLDNGCYL